MRKTRQKKKIAGEITARHVTKFDGKTFLGWKFQLNAVFVAHDIADIVDGTRVRPAGEGDNVKSWIKDDAKAKFLMSSAMEYSQLECLLSCTTAREMCTRLTSIHKQ